MTSPNGIATQKTALFTFTVFRNSDVKSKTEFFVEIETPDVNYSSEPAEQ
jgi:hypothetical protein